MNPESIKMPEAIHFAMEAAWSAYLQYRLLPRHRRVEFMYAIAHEIEALGDELIATAHSETHLPVARLIGERARTCFQLRSYADACLQGDWLDARIDTGDPLRSPPKPDLRKMNVPLGPVVVFGASNFPFAYSTAGGDTACAFAAGCPVVVKAHPAHPQTSDLVAAAILSAAKKCNLPEGIFGHVHGDGHETGALLVQHPRTKAVGFTGSFRGGKALYDLAQARPEPIPVFAEMGSVNPIYLLPGQLSERGEDFARQIAASITLGVGQFCTNPGVIVGLQGADLDRFAQVLRDEIIHTAPAMMLHQGIAAAFHSHVARALSQPEVIPLAESRTPFSSGESRPTIAQVTGAGFLSQPKLAEEVFGPYSILVQCGSSGEMEAVAEMLRGQLTSTFIATEDDLRSHEALVALVQEGCGRVVVNGVPTGVEVVLAQHHGGPFPASTDSRFGAVGADGIRRFCRPLAYQNYPAQLLPPELQNENPEAIPRTVNNVCTKEAIP
jgi:alpha-ketoglutaric semialdehyde dehydrogenase